MSKIHMLRTRYDAMMDTVNHVKMKNKEKPLGYA